MIIRRIQAKRFGCLDDFEVSFKPGLNIIEGPNEAGKSTLHRSILAALLDRPSTKKAYEESRSWGASKLYELEIEFELKDRNRWILSKDFEKNTFELRSQGTQAIDEWAEINATLETALGTVSAKVFRSTVCVSQDELGEISDGKSEISKALEGIVTGGEEEPHTAEAISRLEKAVADFERGLHNVAPRNPGPIARLLAQQTGYVSELENATAQIEAQDQTQEQLQEIEAKLKEVSDDLEAKRATSELGDRAIIFQNEQEISQRKEKELDIRIENIVNAEETISDVDIKLSELSQVASLGLENAQALNHLHERLQVLREQKDKPEKESQTPMPDMRSQKVSLGQVIFPIAFAILGLAGVIAVLALAYFQSNAAWIVATCIPALILLGSSAWLVRKLFFGRSSGINAGLPIEPPEVSDSLIQEVEAELVQKLALLGCSDWATFEISQQKVLGLKKTRDDATSRLGAFLSSGTTKELLINERKEASKRRRDAEEKLDTPEFQRVRKLGPIEFQGLKKEVAGLELRQKEFEGTRIRLEGRIKDATVSQEDIANAEEKLSAVTADLERAQERLEVYQLSLETMKEARRVTMVRAQDNLGPKASRYLEHLTNGRYSNLSVDSDLNVVINMPGKAKGSIDPAELSKGTQDQLYFSLRLALIDSIFSEANPPLFLDDPFVKFDPQRRAAAIDLCHKIAQQRQVLLFTCSNEYSRAGHLITMTPKTIIKKKQDSKAKVRRKRRGAIQSKRRKKNTT